MLSVFWHQILSPIKSWNSGRARTVCNNSELEAYKVFRFLSHLNFFQHSESTWCSRADWELTLNFQHRHHRPHLMFTSNAHGLVIWTEHYYFALHPSLHFRELTRLNSTTFFSWSWWISCARFVVHTRGAFVVSWAFAWKTEASVWVNEVESGERKEGKSWERKIVSSFPWIFFLFPWFSFTVALTQSRLVVTARSGRYFFSSFFLCSTAECFRIHMQTLDVTKEVFPFCLSSRRNCGFNCLSRELTII